MLKNMLYKQQIQSAIEPFIYEKLSKDSYHIERVLANKLLTWNRFDLAFKLFYLDNKIHNVLIAKKVYKEDIKAQTLGKFIELGNEVNKKNIIHYFEQFNSTYENIKENGFLQEKTLIPLSIDGGIINGAHRVASAIHLNKEVAAITTEQSIMIADYEYFFERGVPVDCLDVVAQKFIEYSNDNVHIAFLWPSGEGFKNEAESLFSKVVYKKKISLTFKGAFNLLYELYKHMDWVGTREDGFKGIKQKLTECFPNFQSFQIIIFQSENLERVQSVKEKVRNIYKIGYSSIHITDTKEEAIRVSQLLFNPNGLHFLNNSEPNKYAGVFDKLNEFKMYLEKNNINPNDVVIDGSLTLSLYGLRKNMDVDFLVSDNVKIEYSNDNFETHDSELIYHGVKKSELIYDHKYYFIFQGIKLISFHQLFIMKSKRNEDKDKNDCLIMEAAINGSDYQKLYMQYKQKILYTKIKLARFILVNGMQTSRALKLYKPIRFMYRLIKGLR